MKIKKNTKKITSFSFGTIIAITTPIALVYSINFFRGQGPKEVILSKSVNGLSNKSLTVDEIQDKIFEGGFLDLTVEDLMKIIRALKSDKESRLKNLVLTFAPQVIEYVKKIENSTFRLIFEILLNKGISNLSSDDIAKIEKVIKLFVKSPDKIIKYMKYVYSFTKRGLTSILLEDDNKLFNKFLPKITDNIVELLVKKPKKENAKQRELRIKKQKEINVDLKKLIKKLLIDGYKEDGGKSAIDLMALDVTNLIYKITDKIPEKFYGIVETKPIVEDVIRYLIDSIFSPAKNRIDNKITAINKNIELLNNRIDTINKNTKISLTKTKYNVIKEKVNEFKKDNPYDYLMYELGISNEDLEYVKNNYIGRKKVLWWYVTKEISEHKWYEKEYNSYWVLANSLWHSGHENKKYKTFKEWKVETKKAWIYGVGREFSPDHDATDILIEEAYGKDVLDKLKSKYQKIKGNLKPIKDNYNKKIIQPIDFTRDDFFGLKKYEDMKKISSLKEEILDLLRSRIYQFETNNNISKKVLMNNELLNGKGILKLSKKDLSNLLYKLQDFIANIDIYLDITIDKTIANNALISAASFFLKIGGINIKSEINELALPIIKKVITPDLIMKIQTISTEDVSLVIHDIFHKGLSGINDQTIMTSTNIIEKFVPSMKIELEKQDLSNILKIIKYGLKYIPRPMLVETIHKITDISKISTGVKQLIKTLIT